VYYQKLKAVVDYLKSSFEELSDIQEIGTKLRLAEKNYLFPRIDILPEREVIREEKIHNGERLCTFTLRIVPALKSYNEIKGSLDLLKLTGDVYDKIYDKRRDFIKRGIGDDIYVDTIENHYFKGNNFVLYLSSIMLICELRF